LSNIQASNPGEALLVGGHIVLDEHPAIPAESHGYLTSGCVSPALEKSVGLALVKSGRERIGEEVYVFASGKTVAAKLTTLSHYDPEGGRVHG
jgi:glycine cleavage system aminomethyltransferase T